MLAPAGMAVWELARHSPSRVRHSAWRHSFSARAVACHPAFIKLELKTRDGFECWSGRSRGFALLRRRVSSLWHSCDSISPRRIFRGRVGLDHHRRHGALRPRLPSPLDQLVAVICSLAGRHGAIIYCAWRSFPAGGRRQCRVIGAELPGPMKGHKLTPLSEQTRSCSGLCMPD